MKPKWHWTNQANKEEIRERISASLEGRPANRGSFKEGRGNPLKGKKIPWATKLIESRKGKMHAWNKGKKLSAEYRKKLSEAKKGKHHSLETRLKMSATRLERGPWNKGMGLGWPEQYRIRNSMEYKLWREAVFERDDFTCVFCEVKGGDLHADHIRPFSKYPEMRFRISNGRTLCVSCHRKTETYGGKTKGAIIKL